jgi:choline dehydrogenase-like flavoprotein
VETIKAARELVGRAGIVEHIEAQVFPGPEVQSDDEIKDHLLQHVFGT